MYWIDGSVYKGDWVKGVQHGLGCLTLPDGTIKEGPFENNVYMGKLPIINQQTILEDVEGEMQQTVQDDIPEPRTVTKLKLPMITKLNHELIN